MDAKTIKEKITAGQMSEEELGKLLSGRPSRKGNFFKSLLKGFIDGYTVPNMMKTMLEFTLILAVILGTVILSYHGKMDNTITATLLAAVLGFLFAKLR